jgi:hypothetical protein
VGFKRRRRIWVVDSRETLGSNVSDTITVRDVWDLLSLRPTYVVDGVDAIMVQLAFAVDLKKIELF